MAPVFAATQPDDGEPDYSDLGQPTPGEDEWEQTLRALLASATTRLSASWPELPAFLCHYTSADKLDPILRSGNLLAKDYRHTNDLREGRVARWQAARLLRDAPADIPQELRQSLETWACQGTLHDGEHRQFFIGSLTTDPANTRMWHAYGDRDRGVCLVFRARDLAHADPTPRFLAQQSDPVGFAPDEPYSLAPVIYDPAEQRELVADVVRAHAQVVREVAPVAVELDGTERTLVDRPLIEALTLLSFVFKRRRWSHEREWRAVSVERVFSRSWDARVLTMGCAGGQVPSRPATDVRTWDDLMRQRQERQERRSRIESIPLSLASRLCGSRMPLDRVVLGPRCTDAERVREIVAVHAPGVPVVETTP